MSTPLMSVSELMASTTGIDWSMIPTVRADLADQQAAAARILRQATGWVTNYCNQKMQATADQEIFSYPSLKVGYRDGIFTFFPTRFPLIAVDKLEISGDAVTWQALAGTPILNGGAGQVVQTCQFVTGPASVLETSVPFSYGAPSFIRLSYRDGYPNGFLTADAALGATSLTLDDVIGFQPNDSLTLYDGDTTEEVTVAAGYSYGSNPLPLAAPTLYAHAIGVNASEVDESIRQAIILYTAAVAKNDYNALIASNRTTGVQGKLSDQQTMGEKLLNRFRRVGA